MLIILKEKHLSTNACTIQVTIILYIIILMQKLTDLHTNIYIAHKADFIITF